MLKKGLLLPCIKLLPIALSVLPVGASLGFADELPINERQAKVLVDKASAMEAEIQRRQQEMAVQVAEESKEEYQSGFEDGYNKAILDLLKSKLLHDPTLSPKPKGAGLHAPHRAPVLLNPPQARQHAAQGRVPRPDAVTSPRATGAAQTTPAVVNPTPMATRITETETPVVSSTQATQAPSGSVIGPTSDVIHSATTAPMAGAIADETAQPPQEVKSQQPLSRPQSQETEPQSNQQAIAQPSQSIGQTDLQHKKAQEWLQKSNDYAAQKNWQPAIQAATQALALDAGLVDSYVVRAWARAESGKTQQALEDIGNAIRLDPDNALAYNNRAYIHELLDNTSNAQQDYQQACTLGYQPACETVRKLKQMIEQQQRAGVSELTNLSYRQFQQKDWQGVVASTTRLLELDSKNTTALVNRAGAYTELGLYSKALDDCNAALILDPEMAIAYNNKGYVWEMMGEYKKAAMEYETACVLGLKQSCNDFKRLSQKVSAR